MEYQRLNKYEASILPLFNYTTIITIQDRDLIKSPKKDEIIVVPNGVDMQFFKPMEQEKIYDVVFTGNMSYPPNILAAKFLVNDILPILQESRNDIRILIAGALPHPSVKVLASESVTVSGWLDDIRTAYASSRVFVAPMQIGTGLQNKLLEAMAMKIPSVTSDLANAALRAKADLDIKVAPSEDKQVYAKHILELLKDSELATKQADAAYNFIKNNYSWESSVETLQNVWTRKDG